MNKKLIKLIILFLGIFAIFLICKQTDANNKHHLELVYPKSDNVIIDAKSTFLIGNTNYGSTLFVNHEKVEVLPNGSFALVVKLKEGENSFNLTSTFNGEEKSLKYIVKRPLKVTSYPHSPLYIDKESITLKNDLWLTKGDELVVKFNGAKWNKAELLVGDKVIPMNEFWGHYTARYVLKNDDSFKDAKVCIRLSSSKSQIIEELGAKVSVVDAIIGQIVKDESIIRETLDGRRLTPLHSGTKLLIKGKSDNSYRFMLNNQYAWVKCDDVKLLENFEYKGLHNITGISVAEDDSYINLLVTLDELIPFTIKEENNVLIVNIGDIATSPDIKSSIVEMGVDSNIATIKITPPIKALYGYDYCYSENTLVVKIRKIPVIDDNNPLFKKVIAIDPGHGGKELGAIGPTGVTEKEINLKIAQYLKTELEKCGAIVVMTRENDKQVALDDRVKIAKSVNADVLLSLHNNALPDGKDLNSEHGTSVYYYHPHSKLLAEILHESLLNDLKLKNYGVHRQSFVLTRPTYPVSALIETGFMIYPYEYTLLITDTFQKKAAVSIKNGLEEYFRRLK